MDKSGLLSFLNEYKMHHQAEYGIKQLGPFGSAARGAATDLSDIDIAVELKKQDLFLMIGIKQDLEVQLGSKVDIISYREKMNPFLKCRIEQEAVYACQSAGL